MRLGAEGIGMPSGRRSDRRPFSTLAESASETDLVSFSHSYRASSEAIR